MIKLMMIVPIIPSTPREIPNSTFNTVLLPPAVVIVSGSPAVKPDRQCGQYIVLVGGGGVGSEAHRNIPGAHPRMMDVDGLITVHTRTLECLRILISFRQ